MNKTLTMAVGALIGIAAYATPALAQVGVSITAGQPGFYGRIDLGDAPRPRIIYFYCVNKHVMIARPLIESGGLSWIRAWNRDLRSTAA